MNTFANHNKHHACALYDSRYKCEECGTKLAEWTREVSIEHMGDILFWRIGGAKSSSGAQLRLHDLVSFGELAYRLRSIVQYRAGAKGGGHYVTYQLQEDTWVLIDDSSIRQVWWYPPSVESSPHLLVFERCADQVALINNDTWRHFLSLARKFKLQALNENAVRCLEAEEITGSRNEFPHVDEDSLRRLLVCLKSYFLSDFNLYSYSFWRDESTFEKYCTAALKKKRVTDLTGDEHQDVQLFWDLFNRVAARCLRFWWQNARHRRCLDIVFRGCRFATIEEIRQYCRTLATTDITFPISASVSCKAALEFAWPNFKVGLWELRLNTFEDGENNALKGTWGAASSSYM